MTAQAQAPAQAPLSITDALPLARNIARRMARSREDVDDLVQVAMFAFHRQSATASLRPHVAIRRAIQYYYRSRMVDDAVQMLPLPDAKHAQHNDDERAWNPRQAGDFLAIYAGLDGSSYGAQEAFEQETFELDDYYRALEREVGPLARKIATNLVSPEGECAEKIIDEIRARQRAQLGDANAKRPRGTAKTVRVSERMVKTALGISDSDWRAQMVRIRTFTRDWQRRIAR